jgi:dTDP-4-dehydrorhamnose 3,5-epimerase
MGAVTVDDIITTSLKIVSVEGGNVMHAMKFTDAGYVDFGEAYFSKIDMSAIKAWKKHNNMTLNLIVPFGSVRLIFIDDKGGVREELIGDGKYARVTVPPGIWFGFQGRTAPFSIVLNIADIPHSPDEVERKDIEKIQFDWGKI